MTTSIRSGGPTTGCRLAAVLAALLTLATVGLWGLVPAGATVTGTTTRVSVATDGTQANGTSQAAEINADGRYVAFDSSSTNLVPADTNTRDDVFVHDRQTGATTRVSVGSDGTQANNASQNPSLSDDGRYVAFSSTATNLVAGDTNGVADVFVHDRQTGATTRVSVGSDGTQANAAAATPAISGDGNVVAFRSAAGNLTGLNAPAGLGNIFAHDRQAGTTTRVSVSFLPGQQVAGVSSNPAISGDGRYVAYDTSAANVVENDTNNATDVFLYDRESATTSRVSVATDGGQGDGSSDHAALDGDGSRVAFESDAANLVASDTNAGPDVFVHERLTAETSRVSVATDGTERVPTATNDQTPDISADGRYVSFLSFAPLRPGDPDGGDHYVRDRQKGRTIRVNVATDGSHPDQGGGLATGSISGDGRYVAFDSRASSLVPSDTNNNNDIFVRDRGTVPTEPAVSVSDVRVHEGDAGSRPAVFTVSLSKPSTSTVTVAFATQDGSATDPADYEAKAGMLSFPPGATSLPVKVRVAGDTVDEASQVFQLVLSEPIGAFLADSIGSGTIFDDDPNSGGARLAIGDAIVHEGDAGARVAVFNVSLSSPFPSTVTVSYATVKDTATGTDFTKKSGSLTFAPGVTSMAVKVQIAADTVPEGSENYTVSLFDATPSPNIEIADNSGFGRILDND